jgi:ribosomal protein S18 acetylase RimI-like enzyme
MISSPGPFTVRSALVSDAARIAELGAHVFSVSFAHSVEPHELTAYLKASYSTAAIQNDLTDDLKNVLVATDGNDQIVGFGYLNRASDEPCLANVDRKVELQRIYIDPAAQGKSVGGLLAKRLESLAKERGFQNMWLGVWEENNRALQVYERWGYRVVGGHSFTIGSVVQNDLIMLKSLS